MATPRIGKFASSATVSWANGSLFQGFCLVGISKPTISASPVHSVSFGNSGMSEPIPDFYRIPIVDGKYSQVSGLFYTADLTPPGATYVAWLYTQSAQGYYIPVTAASSTFTVSSDSITPPTFTVNTPGAGSTPVPDQNNTDLVIPPSTYTLTGDVDAAGYDITGITALTAITGTFNTINGNTFLGGSFSGTTGTFSGAITGASYTGGAVAGTTGTFSSTVTGTGGQFSGTVLANTVSATQNLTLTGASNQYIQSQSDHLAFYKKTGAENFYWRRSTSGIAGVGDVSLMQLSDSSILTVTGSTPEAQVLSTGSADAGFRVTDSVRSYKIGINVAAAGSGKLTIHNVTSGTTLATFDDTKTKMFAGFNVSLTTYASNAAALGAGKVAGDFYTDGSGNVKVVF